MTTAPIIFRDFSFKYDSQAEPTLKKLNVTIEAGEKVVIVGPSGSGKTTFAHCLNGLIPHLTHGEIQGNAQINGHEIGTQSIAELSFQVGTVLQDTDGQFIGLTVAEDIAFVLENDTVAQATMIEKVQHWAELVQMERTLTQRPQDLSGGQKQRVSMAGVLASETPILLFDEPLANLDPQAGQAAIQLIDDIHQQTNATTIIVEHRLEDVLSAPVDRIIVFAEGEIVADATPQELLQTNILMTHGIREPLYITALKYAGVDLATLPQLTDWTALAQLPAVQEAMQQWLEASVPAPQAEPNEPLLTLTDLYYQYPMQPNAVLDRLSLTVQRGERLSIVGRNGAGKSTLLKAICGFIEPTGALIWEQEDLRQASLKDRADKIGYVMQNPNQMISQKTVFEEAALGLVLRDVPQAEIESRVAATLQVCGLYPYRHWPISALSYGQKKRVTIAAILVLEPEMLILDEPTAGQDFQHYTEMMAFIETLQSLGKTIVMITHDMHLMMEYSDRTVVIDDGQVIADDCPVNILLNETLVKQASLHMPPLFQFAQWACPDQAIACVAQFIREDREVRQK